MPVYAGYEDFDVAYSISDLHLSLGGSSATSDVALLADTVRLLRESAKTRRAALVLNGDIVDFLDIEPATVFDFDGAASKLDRVFAVNAALWTELAALANEQTLVLTLGNHDIELTLPQCRAMLRKRLGPRALLAFEGAGYRCRVGGCNVLFTHGNNDDPWNAVDLEALGAQAAAAAAGIPPLAWDSNEGSKLVVEVLNDLKAQHPFVDYLKPEGPWLLGLFERLGFGAKVSMYARMIARQAKASAGFASRRTTQTYFLGEGGGRDAVEYDADDLMWRARQGGGASTRFAPGAKLGLFTASEATPEDVKEYVRTQMRDEGKQATFHVDAPDDVYGALRARVGGEIHVLVCGHTHLRRAWSVSAERAYFNSGTWLRLMDIGRASQSDDGRRAIYDAFKARTRDELDAISWDDGGTQTSLVAARPTIVELKRLTDNRGLTGRLMDVLRRPPIQPAATGEVFTSAVPRSTIEVRP